MTSVTQFDRNEPQSKVLDSMSDGQWHALTKISRRNIRYFAKEVGAKDADDALLSFLDDLTAEGILLAGANSSYRLLLPHLEQWRTTRSLDSASQGKLHVPRYFGGILEDDGWKMAPLRTFDLVHFRAGGSVDPQRVQEEIGLIGVVSQDEDGLMRITTLNGALVYDIIKNWSKDQSLDISGVRADTNVRRRELSDLPARYVEDMCVFYGSFAHTLLRKYMSSVRKHINEREDVQQRIFMWIIDAIQRYDDSTSIPFAAYLSTALKRWVQDLNRKSYGRAAADNELKHTRAITAFESENGRKPTTAELAEMLNEDVAVTRERSASIEVVNNLRSVTTLDSLDYDIPITSSDDHAQDLDAEVNQTLLSAALTTAAVSGGHNIIGWLSMYEQTWGAGVPSAKSLGVDTKTLSSRQEEIRIELQKRLADFHA